MMDNLNFVFYRDSTLRDSHQTSGMKYRLSIEFALNGFSFCVKSQDGSKALALGYFPMKYKSSYLRAVSHMIELFETEWTLSRISFSEVDVYFADTAYTILPEQLFDLSNASNYLSFSKTEQIGSHTSNRTIPGTNLVCAFEYVGEVLEYWQSRCEDVRINHSMAGFAELVMWEGPKMSLHINMLEDKSIYLVLVNDGRLELVNTFEITAKYDFAYYLLLVCEQANIDKLKCPVKVYGSCQMAIEQRDTLDKYFPNREFAKRSSEICFSQALDFVTPWEYYTILNKKTI